MRKSLLLVLLLPVVAFGQVSVKVKGTSAPISGTVASESPLKSPVRLNNDSPTKSSGAISGNFIYEETVIGESQYDLQSNTSLANRIINHNDGTISVAYTMSSDGGPAYSTRGTGYMHFNGTEWTEMPFERLEDKRAGWCNIGTVEVDGVTREFVVSHHAAADGDFTGGLYILMNDKVGSTDFSVVEEIDVANKGPLWPRAVGSGSYIHIYTASFNEQWQPTLGGILRPNIYFRYDAANDDLIDEYKLLPDYISDSFYVGAVDAYQMDVRGDVIAIVKGGSGQDLLLHKSTDNGDTWTTTVVDDFRWARYAEGSPGDTSRLRSNSGSVEVLIDNDDNCHVWWSHNFVNYQTLDPSDTSTFFFPGTDGIIYWNENNTNIALIDSMPDIDGDGVTNISAMQINGTENEQGARYAGNTISCYPDAAIDADGNIFLIYSAPNEEARYPNNPDINFRDVFVKYSTDGGNTWSASQSLVESHETEDVFAHIARDVDDNVHITWQRDDFAGMTVTNGHPSTINSLMYAAIPKSLILNDGLGYGWSSIADVENPFKLSKAFPNPTTGNSVVNLDVENAGDVTVQITNITGQTVYNADMGEMSAGQAQIELPVAGYEAGIYIYTITVDGAALTGRLVVE